MSLLILYVYIYIMCGLSTCRCPLVAALPFNARMRRSRIGELEAANVRAAAQQTADSLLLQFQRQGFADAQGAAERCLRTSLELLGAKDFGKELGRPQVLVPPDEFKNPSSFLRLGAFTVGSRGRGGCMETLR